MLVGLFFVAHQTGLIPKPLKKKIKWYWIAENDNNQIILNVFLWSFRNHSSLQNNIRSNITNFFQSRVCLSSIMVLYIVFKRQLHEFVFVKVVSSKNLNTETGKNWLFSTSKSIWRNKLRHHLFWINRKFLSQFNFCTSQLLQSALGAYKETKWSNCNTAAWKRFSLLLTFSGSLRKTALIFNFLV